VKRRYLLAPEAARDVVAIWRYLKQQSSEKTADDVESHLPQIGNTKPACVELRRLYCE
jgi:hypothetical protein